MSLLICLLGMTSGYEASAAPPADHQQALRDLRSADAQARREAIAWLAREGGMEDLGALAGALHDEEGDVRQYAEGALVQVWSRSGDAQIDAWLKTGIGQMSSGLMGQAIDTFSRIIEARPEFAEGWNKRATAYYLMGAFDLSLRDCDEVMRRNPLHFGALSGYGMIYLKLGELEKALEYFQRALDVNPNIEGAKLSVQILLQRLGREGKQAI
jgi:tetratricopeptide (TPR) repeat protein